MVWCFCFMLICNYEILRPTNNYTKYNSLFRIENMNGEQARRILGTLGVSTYAALRWGRLLELNGEHTHTHILNKNHNFFLWKTNRGIQVGGITDDRNNLVVEQVHTAAIESRTIWNEQKKQELLICTLCHDCLKWFWTRNWTFFLFVLAMQYFFFPL